MTDFIPGRELCRAYFTEAIAPVLAEHFPTLRYSAALIGPGSDVLGYDTPVSMDHFWGPRAWLFLGAGEAAETTDEILSILGRHLPTTFRGHSTHYTPPDEIGVRLPVAVEDGPISPLIFVRTAEALFGEYGLSTSEPPTLTDWLSLTQQHLLELTGGEVFHDGLGVLNRLRAHLVWYPHDLWLYLLAAQWQKIGEEEAFVGRCGDVGDELGSRLIAAGLVRSIMRLGFLLEKRYAPYSKWFGTAFARLDSGATLSPLLENILSAGSWREREHAIGSALLQVLELQNARPELPDLQASRKSYHGRPYTIVDASSVAQALLDSIRCPDVRALPPGVGAVDQFVDSAQVLQKPTRTRALRPIWNIAPSASEASF